MSMNFEDWVLEKKKTIPNKDVIKMECLVNLINTVKSLLFPGFVEHFDDAEACIDEKIAEIKVVLTKLLKSVEIIEAVELDKKSIVDNFLIELPKVDELLRTDLDALYEGDPAADSTTEIILCYPGFKTIFIYRIANILYRLGVPVLPRAMTEYAHSRTGIDIHPGATIGPYFFIDHGTGIVIGQTTVIGQHVKLYQGVTLGALSLREGQKLKGTKRHPTIEDNVTIYSGASIFGDTVIGKNCTIGSSAYITSDVEPDTLVTIQGQKKKHI